MTDDYVFSLLDNMCMTHSGNLIDDKMYLITKAAFQTFPYSQSIVYNHISVCLDPVETDIHKMLMSELHEEADI